MNGIIFDMDGTLGDTMPMILRALQETFARFAGREYTPAEIIDMFGPTEEGLIRMRVPQAESQTAVKYYIERYAELHTSMTQPFPGVIQLLEALQRRGIRRGLVTGKGPLTAEISLNAMGLAPYLETMVYGSHNGGVKSASIQRVLQEWKLAPEQAAYVGDMASDMDAARQAGVLPLAAAWSESATAQACDGVRKFYTVKELLDWLEKN